jgi:hypothetical protein
MCLSDKGAKFIDWMNKKNAAKNFAASGKYIKVGL